jgi:DNA-binding NtrC family response regulator
MDVLAQSLHSAGPQRLSIAPWAQPRDPLTERSRIAPNDAGKVEAVAFEYRHGAPKVALVIEPDAILRELIGIVVEEAGSRPVLAANLGEAVIGTKDVPLGFIVTELIEGPLHVLDPLTIRHLRSAWPVVPVILCTSRLGADRLDPASWGLLDVVTKPFELDQLVAACRRAARISDLAGDASA